MNHSQHPRAFTTTSLVARGLGHHWRTHLAVVLGVAVGTATLTGALFVGDSMRASLRLVALQRLGPVDHALVAQRYFRESLAEAVAGDDKTFRAVPIIMLSGSATHADSAARADRIQILGVDKKFWALESGESRDLSRADSQMHSRSVVVNESLARELNANPGDDVLLRLPSQSTISSETLLGHRDRPVETLRLTVEKLFASSGLGGLSLAPSHEAPKTAFVPLATLQKAVQQSSRANVILVARTVAGAKQLPTNDQLQQRLHDAASLADYGLKLRPTANKGYSLESDRLLLEPAAEEAARAAAERIGLAVTPVLTYLANDITVVRAVDQVPRTTDDGPAERQSIPYSTIAAIDGVAWFSPITDPNRPAPHPSSTPRIVLNEWASDALHAQVGDRIDISYYVTSDFGRLETKQASFELTGIVPLAGEAADPTFSPEYPGVTDVESMADWDAPFPVDLKKVTPRDEEYWKKHRATPKAFVPLAHGQELWGHDADRFGRLSSIRLRSESEGSISDVARTFETELLKRLDPAKLGLRFQPVREQALSASEGATDFGGLFLGFSFFLIVSAAMLTALLFRLSVERRSKEAGLLLSVGLSPRKVAMLFLAEGAVLSAVGGAIGLVGALGYSWLMLAGLRTWWSGAVAAPVLILAASPTSAVIGFAAGWLVAAASIAWSIRGLTRASVRSLLQGAAMTSERRGKRRAGWLQAIIAAIALTAAVILLVLAATTQAVSQTLGFFFGGSLLLIAAVAAIGWWIARRPAQPIEKAGLIGQIRLAARNATRQPGRTRLTVSLIASATFLIVALHAFRIDADSAVPGKSGGTGGFTLFARSTVPLLADLNSASGRESVNLPAESTDPDTRFVAMPFRASDGDDTSCLNLYMRQRPRMLGAPPAMVERGGFAFVETLAAAAAEHENPWRLLDRTYPDGAIPAIGDESAVRWQLHSGLGKDFIVTDERGREVRLRFVALLRGSVLQSELVVSEANFIKLFPTKSGYSLFLIESTPAAAKNVGAFLEKSLAQFGFDASPVGERLAAYAAVQNTYLSTFQSLGGLGLILGTLGLTAVMLRNVWERRAELALMRAVGFSRGEIGVVVLLENAILVVAGLLAGLLPAVVVVFPQLMHGTAQFPIESIVAILSMVFFTGVISGAIALIPTLRAALITALRSE